MSFLSIPKARLVRLILDDLKAEEQAIAYFRIQKAQSVDQRLMAFNKNDLLSFILGLGEGAENILRTLSSSFPFRTPPTLYISIVERIPDVQTLLNTLNLLVQRQPQAIWYLGENRAIRSVYIVEPPQQFAVDRISVLEIKVQYERKVELVQPDIDSENYGELYTTYSLETAILWLPVEQHHHSIIACCDYPALQPIRDFFEQKLGLWLNPPNLSKSILERIVRDATPRSASFTLVIDDVSPESIQSITFSDPSLEAKNQFLLLSGDENREQTAGYYTNHPGLALGGIGVARRDGKIWTPKRLDRRMIASLAMTLIAQTEDVLSEIDNIDDLTVYYFGNITRIGRKRISGSGLDIWMQLFKKTMTARNSRQNEVAISVEFLHQIIKFKNILRVLTAIEYQCGSCGIRWLRKCPRCSSLLKVSYSDSMQLRCDNCGTIDENQLTCECGEPVEFVDISTLVRVLPERELVTSIVKAAERANELYSGYFVIQGLLLKYIPARRTNIPATRLNAFQAWHAHMNRGRGGNLSQAELIEILNKTKEKCKRDNRRPSDDRCKECLAEPLNPRWIRDGKTCLLRLFGIPINIDFDGVHHGHEVADLRYEDTYLKTGERKNIGIHVKSRHRSQPAEGMGRSKRQIRELYTQLAYSAYQAATGNQNLQVIGIGIPNTVHQDVIESMQYLVNSLGFTFLLIDELDWEVIISRAFEEAEFDFQGN